MSESLVSCLIKIKGTSDTPSFVLPVPQGQWFKQKFIQHEPVLLGLYLVCGARERDRPLSGSEVS